MSMLPKKNTFYISLKVLHQKKKHFTFPEKYYPKNILNTSRKVLQFVLLREKIKARG